MSQKALHRVAVSVPVFLLKERTTYIAYTPVLDLSASGSSTAKARKNFEVVLRLFLEELMERGTLEAVLDEMGWVKEKRGWQPPVEIRQATQVPFTMPVGA